MSTHKFLFLFEKLKKNLFKESRFVFDGPENHEPSKAEDPEAKEARLLKDKVEAEKAKEAERSSEAEKAAKTLAEENKKLDEDLNKLDQTKFDKIIKERIAEKGSKGDLEKSKIDALTVFAAKNDPEKNLQTLFEEFKEQRLHTNQLGVKTINIFIKTIKEKDLQLLIEELVKTEETTNTLIEAAKDNTLIIKQTFDLIKDSDIFKKISQESLNILADKLVDADFKEFLAKVSNNQKGTLLSSNIDSSKKEEIFNNLIRSRIFDNGEPQVIEKIILFVCKDRPGLINTTINAELVNTGKEAETYAKLTYNAAKALAETTFPKFDSEQQSQSIFLGLEKYLSKDTIKQLIEDKDLKFEIREKLFNDLLPSKKEGISKPTKAEEAAATKPAEEPVDKRRGPEEETPVKGGARSVKPEGSAKAEPAKVEAPKPAEASDDAKAAPAEAEFAEEKDWKTIIEKMGDDLRFDGKNISWTLPITIEGEKVDSERSFRVSKKFLKELNETDENGRVHNTKDKVKLCAYQWLFEHIYKGDVNAKMKGKVKSFKESQAYLVDQIKTLKEKIKAETATPATAETGKPANDKLPAKVEAKVEEKDLIKESLDQAKFDTALNLVNLTQNDVNKLAKFAIESKDTSNKDKLIKALTSTIPNADKLIKALDGQKDLLEKVAKILDIYQAIRDGISEEAKTILTKNLGIRVEPAKAESTEPAKAETAEPAKTGAAEPARPAETPEPAKAAKVVSPAESSAVETRRPVEAVKESLSKDQTKTKLDELKTKGLEITGAPETLTKEQASTLDESLKSFTDILKTANDAFEVISALKTIGRNFSKNFEKPTEIKLIDSKSKVTLTWSASNNTPNNGFEETNPLLDKILEIKSVELGGRTNEKYEEFFNQSRIARTETQRADDESKKTKEYYAKYKELTSQIYTVDYAIGDMSEGDIVKNWGNFENRRPVETIMGKPPFGLSSMLAGTVATKILTEGRNDRVYFSDVFKFAKELPGFKAIASEGKISAELLQDGDKVLGEYEKLLALGKTDEANYIFEKIIAPSLKLVDAISRLRFDEKREGPVTEKDSLEVAKKSLPESQKAIIESLQKLLNYSEDTAGGWEKFLGWISGAEKITMANMDGTTFDVDEGMFKRHFDPKAALSILLEKPNLYTIKDGKKEINEPALLAEVNELMQRGYAIKEIQKAKASKGTLTSEQIKAIQEGSKKYAITDLKNATFTEDQTKAFQLGFINKEIEESENTVEKGLDNYLNSIFAEKPLGAGELKIFREILKQGGPRDAEKLKDVRAKFAEVKDILKKEAESMKAGGKSTNIMHGHLQFDQNGNVLGGGIAVPIKLKDGATMTVALGAGELTPGQIVPIGALGFSLKIAGGEGWNVNFNTVVTVSGAFAGVSGHHESDSGVEVDWMAGVSASWWNIVDLGVGLGVSVSWDKAQLKSEREGAKEKVTQGTGWTKEDLEKWPKMSTEEKLALLEKSPEWASIKAVQDALPQYLSKENLVRAYDSQISELKASADRNAEKPFPSLIPVGIGFGAMAPALIALAAGNPGLGTAIALIAGLKFRLGTVEIFIPHPKEEQRILELATDANVRAKIAEAFSKMKSGEEKVIFEEKTADVYYRPGSKLGKGIRIDNKEIDFSRLRNDIGTYNDALEKGGTEIRLDKKADGKIELAIDNLFNKDKEADKDLEVHIDPNLLTLGVIQDGGKIFLEGKIDDLIITRERFRFSSLQAEGRSSIRDVVTIRQNSSLSGKKKIDRAWLQENEQSYLEILMGKNKFKMEKGGGNIGLLQDNIREIKGFAESKGWEKGGDTEKDFAKHFHQFRPEELKVGNEGKIIDKSKVEAMKADVKEMHKALGAITKEAFEKEQPRAGFNEKIQALFIDPDFHEAYGSTFDSTDTPELLGHLTEIVQFFTNKSPEFGLQNLTPKELALAENKLRDLWFTTAYRCEGALSKLNLKPELSAKLRKAGFKNIRNLDILNSTKLIALCAKKKVSLSEDEAKEILTAVEGFKEKPLSKNELINKNRELKKRMELVKKYSTSNYIEEFERVIPEMNPKLSNDSAKDLVENYFMKGIYDRIFKELDRTTTPPDILDFRKLGMVEIPTASDLVSGTRLKIDGKNVKALSHTLFEQTDKSETQLYASGLVSTTEKEFSLNGTGAERDVARILLELASPIQKGEYLLDSSFAIKVLGLGAYRLIAGEKNYKLMTELAQDKSKIGDPKYKEAVEQFTKLVDDLRQAQHEGKAYETVSAETGKKIIIDMVSDTKIVAGAYTQCTNTSFYVSENGKVKVTGKEKSVVGASEAVTSVADAETQLASVTFSPSAGVSLETAKKQEEEGGGGKHSEQGVKDKPVDDKSSPNGPATAQEVAGDQQANVPTQPASQSASPKKH